MTNERTEMSRSASQNRSTQANHLTQGATSKDNCHEQACYAPILRLARGHLTQLDMRAQRGNRAKRTREL
ncbi:hypothetical protein HKD37_09G024355 [Glycine soja]